MISSYLPRRLRRLVLTALREGWHVEISPDLRVTLRKPGFASIHTGARANDRRSARLRLPSDNGTEND